MMLSYNDAFYGLLQSLTTVYDQQESTAIAHAALEHITKLGKLDRILHKDRQLTEAQQQDYNRIKTELIAGRPLQYALGEAWFMGRPFKVNKHVLIPRPETEELVSWIAEDHIKQGRAIELLDVGTGSGCIPVSLKLVLANAIVSSCDISAKALEVARVNAEALSASVDLFQLDFLNEKQREVLSDYDVIVSNPPYIPQLEAGNMHSNVKDFEPHLALFVPDEDPLLFYRALASFGKGHLKTSGFIYCELHADHAMLTKELFMQEGYKHVELRDDMHGNPRMLKAGKP